MSQPRTQTLVEHLIRMFPPEPSKMLYIGFIIHVSKYLNAFSVAFMQHKHIRLCVLWDLVQIIGCYVAVISSQHWKHLPTFASDLICCIYFRSRQPIYCSFQRR